MTARSIGKPRTARPRSAVARIARPSTATQAVGKPTTVPASTTPPSTARPPVGHKSTLRGPVRIPVGSGWCSVPAGTVVKATGSTAVAITREGSVHVLFDSGGQVVEVDVDARLREKLWDRVSPQG